MPRMKNKNPKRVTESSSYRGGPYFLKLKRKRREDKEYQDEDPLKPYKRAYKEYKNKNPSGGGGNNDNDNSAPPILVDDPFDDNGEDDLHNGPVQDDDHVIPIDKPDTNGPPVYPTEDDIATLYDHEGNYPEYPDYHGPGMDPPVITGNEDDTLLIYNDRDPDRVQESQDHAGDYPPQEPPPSNGGGGGSDYTIPTSGDDKLIVGEAGGVALTGSALALHIAYQSYLKSVPKGSIPMTQDQFANSAQFTDPASYSEGGPVQQGWNEYANAREAFYQKYGRYPMTEADLDQADYEAGLRDTPPDNWKPPADYEPPENLEDIYHDPAEASDPFAHPSELNNPNVQDNGEFTIEDASGDIGDVGDAGESLLGGGAAESGAEITGEITAGEILGELLGPGGIILGEVQVGGQIEDALGGGDTSYDPLNTNDSYDPSNWEANTEGTVWTEHSDPHTATPGYLDPSVPTLPPTQAELAADLADQEALDNDQPLPPRPLKPVDPNNPPPNPFGGSGGSGGLPDRGNPVLSRRSLVSQDPRTNMPASDPRSLQFQMLITDAALS